MAVEQLLRHGCWGLPDYSCHGRQSVATSSMHSWKSRHATKRQGCGKELFTNLKASHDSPCETAQTLSLESLKVPILQSKSPEQIFGKSGLCSALTLGPP